MAGINTLQELYAKRGEAWTREFLSSDLRITEKIDAYRFSFERSNTGKLRFYGKNSETPLNRIDRTVSDLYEGAIQKIENLPNSLISSIPKSHRFGFSWLPDSGLTLTDITIRQNGKITKQVEEKPVMEKWASLLHVKWGDELHRGKLDSLKVNSLMESLKTGKQPLLESSSYDKTYIIKNEDYVTKITPKSVAVVREPKSHSFDLLLLQIFEHIQSLETDRFVFRSNRPDERYIEVVCEAFNRFVTEKGNEFLAMGIKKPRFLERSGKFNRRWIKNEKTLEVLESHHDYEYLLSIFLTNLRKPKKAVGLLTESFVNQYNQKIYEIDENVRNQEYYGFPEFSSILEKETDLSTETEFSDREQIQAVGLLQTYFSRPFHNTNEDSNEEKIVHECNLLFINAGQFTNKVLSECERLLKLTGKSFVIVHDEKAGSRCLWGLNQENGRKAAQQLVKEYPHIFECYESMNTPHLKKLLSAAGTRKVNHLFTGASCESLVMECESLKTVTGQDPSIEITQIRGNSDREISECMEREDFTQFKQIFPDVIQKYWNTMQGEWQQKAYQ